MLNTSLSVVAVAVSSNQGHQGGGGGAGGLRTSVVGATSGRGSSAEAIEQLILLEHMESVLVLVVVVDLKVVVIWS